MDLLLKSLQRADDDDAHSPVGLAGEEGRRLANNRSVVFFEKIRRARSELMGVA